MLRLLDALDAARRILQFEQRAQPVEARARIGVRIPPGQDPERVRDAVVEFLRADPPWGVTVETECDVAVPGWVTETEGSFDDSLLAELSVHDLLIGPISDAANHWRSSPPA